MANWSECPQDDGPARNQWILNAILRGEGDVLVQEIELESGGHTATLHVFGDALQISGVRINVSASLQQQIADAAGCLLLTPKLADTLYSRREVTLSPKPRSITSATSAMIDHSKQIDSSIPSGKENLPVSTVGKHWVLTKSIFSESAKKARKAANYGWHFQGASFQGIKGEPSVSLPNVRVIQGVGTVHNDQHSDYSQVCQLAFRDCIVDGELRDLADVYTDPELSPLVSHEGPLPGYRQPSIALSESSGALQTRGRLELSPRSKWPKLLLAGSLLAVGGVLYRNWS